MSLRRAAAVLAVLVVAVGGVIGLILFFNSRDTSTFEAVSGPGQALPGNGAAQLGFPLDAATLRSLERGNVVLVYADPRARRALRALGDDLAGPPSPALAAAGQEIALRRESRLRGGGVAALAWRRLQRASSAGDPALRDFAEFWLGRGRGSG